MSKIIILISEVAINDHVFQRRVWDKLRHLMRQLCVEPLGLVVERELEPISNLLLMPLLHLICSKSVMSDCYFVDVICAFLCVFVW